MPPTVRPLQVRSTVENHQGIPPGQLPTWFSFAWRQIAAQVRHAGIDRGRIRDIARRRPKDFWTYQALFSGSLTSLDPAQEIRRQAPCSWLIPPGRSSGQRQDPRSGNLELFTCLFNLHLPFHGKDPLRRIPLLSAPIRNAPLVRDNAEAICAHFSQWQPLNTDAPVLTRAPLDVVLCQHVLDTFATAVCPSTRSPESATPPIWFEELCQRLHQDMLGAGCDFRHIVAASGVAPSLVVRSFQRFHGTTALGYLRRIRLDLASRLLRSRTDESIASIASRCGYSSLPLFSRHFTAEFGVSPSRWRHEPTELNSTP